MPPTMVRAMINGRICLRIARAIGLAILRLVRAKENEVFVYVCLEFRLRMLLYRLRGGHWRVYSGGTARGRTANGHLGARAAEAKGKKSKKGILVATYKKTESLLIV